MIKAFASHKAAPIMKVGEFHISTFSAAGNCVAVALQTDGSVKVRHSKDESVQPITFTRDEWDAFVKGVKKGEFDVA